MTPEQEYQDMIVNQLIDEIQTEDKNQMDTLDIREDNLFQTDIFEDVKIDLTTGIYQESEQNYLDDYFSRFEE